MNALLLTATLSFLAVNAPLPEPNKEPVTGANPFFLTVKSDGKMLTTTRLYFEEVPVQFNKEVIRGGKKEIIVVAVMQRVYKVTYVVLDVEKLQAQRVDGTKMDTKALLEAIAGETVVLVSGDGQPVSKAYLKLFRDNTIVLIPDVKEIPKLKDGTQGIPTAPPVPQPIPVPVPQPHDK